MLGLGRPQMGVMDLLGFIVPGALFLWVVGTVFERVLLLPFPITAAGSIGESALFLIVAYFAGHIVQALANPLEDWLRRKKWNGFPSERYWRDDDEHFPTELKGRMKQAALSYFGLPESTRGEMLFNLMYTLCVQRNLSEHTERFNSLYQLYRGLTVAAGACVAGMVTACAAGKSVGPVVLEPTLARAQTALLALMFAGACWLFLRRLERFSGRFADAVYRAFYVYYCSLERSGEEGDSCQL